ncbi:alginate O-acetyltransferase AlgX-related protein [Roseivivax sp.]
MQRVLQIMRHALPLAFLGYAAVVNLQIFTAPEALDGVEGDLVSGEATSELGQLYSAELPHRAASVGLIGAGRYALLGEGRAGVTAGEEGWLFTNEEMTRASEDSLDLAMQAVRRADEALAEMGARLVMIPVPAKADIYRDHAPDGAGARMQAQYDRFRAALNRAGIPAVDTRPALAEAAKDAPVYLTTDTHWTPEGARQVAEAVAASGLIEPGDTRFRRAPAEPEEFVGDLVSFVTSESFAPALGLGPERVTPYVAKKAGGAEGGIFAADAPRVDTLLVGTSYSANDSWSFLPALKLALGRDILNLAEEGRGPVAPMRALLDDPALSEAPPALVLWEYPVRYLGLPQSHPNSEEAPHG